MKSSELIKQLYQVIAEHGDIEVTCTGCTMPDVKSPLEDGPFETTVENLVVNKNHEVHGKAVRLWL
jgi:hypothetical protein